MSIQISTMLDHIESGHYALPVFQRGYVWNRTQVRNLFGSLYRRHPIGGLLVWVTKSETADYRGEGKISAGIVKLLLDGQQRMTSLYGVCKGKAPDFFDGDSKVFTGLHFHLEREEFAFYQPLKMSDDNLWVNVTELMQPDGMSKILETYSDDQYRKQFVSISAKLIKLIGIRDVEISEEEVTGADKTLDVVVDIFNRMNSGGTKLSQGDLALAKICAGKQDARDAMKTKLQKWSSNGYNFNYDWLLRSINTVLTGEAKFSFLHEKAGEFENGLKRASEHIDTLLNKISGRLRLDHDRVLLAKNAFPVMVRHLDRQGGSLETKEFDKLLLWYVQAGMRGRFSVSSETIMDQDLKALETTDKGVDELIKQFRQSRENLLVRPDDFKGSNKGDRFYPILYMLTRIDEALDFGTGIQIKPDMQGDQNKLEVHHIFPKAKLKGKYDKQDINRLANFCFITKKTNLRVGSQLPEEYLAEVETKHPGALASQWIPEDPALWKLDRYNDFLAARRELLANRANALFKELSHGDILLEATNDDGKDLTLAAIESSKEDDEGETLEQINKYMKAQGLALGQTYYEIADSNTGESLLVLDLAWPEGVQPRLSEPVAVLLNASDGDLALSYKAGYSCFISEESFKGYVKELLQGDLEDESIPSDI